MDQDKPKHAAQAYPDRNFSPPVDVLLHESLLYASNPPETECVGPDKSARTVQADLGRYITRRLLYYSEIPYIYISISAQDEHYYENQRITFLAA